MIEAGTDDILKTTISIGVAHSASGQSADQILKRVDEGLYAAKNSGRNKVVTVWLGPDAHLPKSRLNFRKTSSSS